MQIVVNGETQAPAGSKQLASHGGYYPNALTCLGCEATNPPLADVLRLFHQLDGQWLIASPVHWEATHNDAMIVAADADLHLDKEESHLWFARVAEFLKASDIECFYHDACTWLLKLDGKPGITSKSVYSILHQSIMPTLNALDKTLFWQRLLTELQMYLSSCPLNMERENKPTINGLWLWGEGEFYPKTQQTILTDDEVFLNLAGELGQFERISSFSILEKDNLILIKYPNHIDLSALQQTVQKNKVNWYWNNLGYSQQPRRWWSRLWRK
ncbi:Uncharacterized protein conserved in bacteria [Legionella lansingensis]|uniref:Cofactor-independent phosphoglycerate mutase n=1 Tax=Legionella lansingensis TaxID=45067 RepID=A0A0W0VTZ7_9GAMM|nr:hypothetical protein [Legionella lansingensis]KTD23453.1 hypothetical protein Llan_0824 [Legionella lansingensis]SNV50860.1 Uncharacterized protein conserved in bacteria [Legionella lansingensis]